MSVELPGARETGTIAADAGRVRHGARVVRALAVVTSLALAGCGGADDDASTASSTGAVAASAAAPAEVVAALEASLLTPDDLEDGFTEGDPGPRTADSNTPCGTPKILLAVPPLADRQRRLENDQGQLVDQHSYAYASVEEAERAFAAAVANVDCEEGTYRADDGTEVDFEAGAQVLDEQIADEQYAFAGKATADTVVLGVIGVVLRRGPVVTTLTFGALPTKVPPFTLPVLRRVGERLDQAAR